MQLTLILAAGGLGAAASAWGLGRGGRAARAGAIAGGVALLLLLVVAAALDVPAGGAFPAGGAAVPFDGRLAATGYLRFVLGLWGLDAAVLVALAWLLGGLSRLRGILPATLAAMTGTTVVLASTDAVVGAAAGAATGLAVLLAVPPSLGRAAVAAAARELRLSLVVGMVLLAAAALAPATAALAIGGGAIPGGDGTEGPIGTAAGAAALLGLAAVAVFLAVGARLGAIPFHVRFSRLADAASPIDIPLLLAWLAVPVVAAGLAIVDGGVAQVGLPLETERTVMVVLAAVTLAAAALAAFLQDDLRHAAGYLVIADGGLVLLGFAALDPAAWGPVRAWLVMMAASKTALAAWAAVTEDRFQTRSIPDLRGWLRHSPLLGAALLVSAVATFGFPGWAVLEARGSLARLAAGTPWDAVLVLAGFLTLPTYVRLAALGVGRATSRVDRAEPERLPRRRRGDAAPPTLEVETEGIGGGASAPSRAGTVIRRERTTLLGAAVLALALLAALTSWGALDLAGAAAAPAPVSSGPAVD